MQTCNFKKQLSTKDMINITFPDGSVRQYESGVSAFDIANSISPRLAADVLAATVITAADTTGKGQVYDVTRPINEDAAIRLHKWEDAEAKQVFWHSLFFTTFLTSILLNEQERLLPLRFSASMTTRSAAIFTEKTLLCPYSESHLVLFSENWFTSLSYHLLLLIRLCTDRILPGTAILRQL